MLLIVVMPNPLANTPFVGGKAEQVLGFWERVVGVDKRGRGMHDPGKIYLNNKWIRNTSQIPYEYIIDIKATIVSIIYVSSNVDDY